MAGTFQGIGTLQFTPDNKHAYAYNNYVSSTTAGAKLDFTTGGEYIIGQFALGPLINPTDTTDGKKSIAEIKFNTETVMTLNSDAAAQDQQTPQTAKMVVPPFTRVQFNVKGQVDSTSYTGTATFTGKVKGPILQFDLEVMNE
tara:strand:+ start:386 stop:814 length:429 start_codon:yes stop_codon:yes gene_type:complete